MECSPEDLPEAMNDRENWRERVRDILDSGMTLMMMNRNNIGYYFSLILLFVSLFFNIYLKDNVVITKHIAAGG